MLDKLKTLLPYKAKATAIHLALSGVIFVVVLYFILFHWYPHPWFPIDGGWQGVRIMIFVDLVLGPTLTFLVFNPNKTRLALGVDFSFIAVAQISALIWGIYAVHGQRPLAIVFSWDRFYSVDIKALRKQSLDERALETYGDTPVLVYFEWPEEPEKKIELSLKTLSLEIANHEQVEFFRPLAPHLDEVFSRRVALAALLKEDGQLRSKLDRLATKHGLHQAEDLRYARFSGRYEEATLVITPGGEIIGSLPVALEPGTTTPASKNRESAARVPG